MLVTVDVPDEMARNLGADAASRSRKVLEELLLRKYIIGEISGGWLGRALGLDFYEREQFLHENQAIQRINLDGYAKDMAAFEKWQTG